MKRKILSLTLGLCMVLGLMVNAYAAAPSVTGTTTPTVSDVVASDGSVIPAGDIKVSAVQDIASLPPEEAATMTAATEAISSAASMTDFVQSAGIATAVQEVLAEINLTAAVEVAVEDLAPAATFSVASAGAAAEIIANGGTVELSFEVKGISDGDAVVVLVYDNVKWTVVPASIKNGKVVGTFNTLGTVVIMKADQAAADSRVASPQTTGANLDGVWICGAALGLAVLLVSLKRSRKTV